MRELSVVCCQSQCHAHCTRHSSPHLFSSSTSSSSSPSMSGKAPPTGPRALLGTQPPHQPSQPRGPPRTSLTSSPSKPIPTGPRSLLAPLSNASRHPAKHAGGLQSNRHPISIKGNTSVRLIYFSRLYFTNGIDSMAQAARVRSGVQVR